MNEKKLLNELYASSLEFGANWRRPIIELAKEHFPKLDLQTMEKISSYINETRSQIENYFFERYIHDNDEANIQLQKNAYEWIKQKYSWMSKKNIEHAISQGMYYAWHG